MQHEELVAVLKYKSTRAVMGGLIISVVGMDSSSVELAIGRPGFPNVERKLRTGGAILFETPDTGLLEVRVMSIDWPGDSVKALVSLVSPGSGMTGGFAEADGDNSAFQPQERVRIAQCLDQVRESVAKRSDLKPEQIDFIFRKLEEMEQAAARFGRRDWISLVVGTLANTIVSAALGSDVGKFLFRTVGDALSWLFAGTVRFLP